MTPYIKPGFFTSRVFNPVVSFLAGRQWVRNIRVSRAGRLTVGGKTEHVRVEEVPDHEKPPILRAYLAEWAWEVKQFFGGVGADAPEAELARIAPRHPVFRILP